MATALKRPPLWIFALALAARLAVIIFARFDGLYGQDGFAYFDYARQIFSTPLGQPLRGPIYWPIGYPALAALSFRLAGVSALSAQLASLLAGAAVAPLVYEMVVQLAALAPLPDGAARSTIQPMLDRSWIVAAVAAGLIAAFSGQLLQSSVVVMADAPGVFWAALAAFWLLRFDSKRQAVWLLPAAAALALAAITRWIFAGLVLPFAGYVVLACRARRFEARAGLAAHRPRPVMFVASGALFLAVLLPQVAFSQSSAAPVLSHGWLVGWNPANAIRTSFDNPDGHFDYRLPPVLFYAEPLFHPFYLFPLFTPLALLGAWRLRRSRTLVLLGGWCLVLYLYLIGVPYENFRFGLAFFPPLAVLVGAGLHFVDARLSRIKANVDDSASAAPPGPKGPFASTIFRHRSTIAVAIALAASAPFVYRGMASFLSIKSSELAAARYLSGEVPARSNVLTFGLTLTLQHYADFQVEDLSELSPGTLRALACSSSTGYLFVEPQNLELQWVGQAVELNYRWLRDQAGLKELGREGTWVLSQVESHGCSGYLRTWRPIAGITWPGWN
jgi:hypothetical protein